jgi:ribosomal protein L32
MLTDMALIQFTRNHTDHSTDRGYQFEFFCDRCRNGFMSEFKTSATGLASSALRTAGTLFGGMLSRASYSSRDLERMIQGPAHDKAFRDAIDEAKPNFRQCPKCSSWVCTNSCWNTKRSLCCNCAPDIETELAAAQVQATVNQMVQKVRQQDMTRDMDLTTEAVALCPSCGAKTHGAKFCPECGTSIRSNTACGKCGAKYDAGAKFCPECGNKVQ